MSDILILIAKLRLAATNFGANQFTNPILAQKYHDEMLELNDELNNAIEVFGNERYDAGQLDTTYYSAIGDH